MTSGMSSMGSGLDDLLGLGGGGGVVNDFAAPSPPVTGKKFDSVESFLHQARSLFLAFPYLTPEHFPYLTPEHFPYLTPEHFSYLTPEHFPYLTSEHFPYLTPEHFPYLTSEHFSYLTSEHFSYLTPEHFPYLTLRTFSFLININYLGLAKFSNPSFTGILFLV